MNTVRYHCGMTATHGDGAGDETTTFGARYAAAYNAAMDALAAVCRDCGHRHGGHELRQRCPVCPCLTVPAIMGR